MKAVVATSAGPPSVLEYRDIPKRKPDDGWVLVKVRAFGLNRAELFTRQGHSPGVTFPRVLGIECVGEVAEDPAKRFEVGQPVAAIMGGMGRQFDGSYGEYCTVPESCLTPLPESTLPWEVLGAIPEMFQTASGSLEKGLGLSHGQRLLIRGGTSSVGLTALTLAKQKGLEVITTSRQASRVDFLMAKGADEVLIENGALANKLAGSVDGILELVGTKTLLDSLRCAKPGGTVCMTGILGGEWRLPSFEPMSDIPHTVRLTAYSGGSSDLNLNDLEVFLKAVEKNEIQVSTDRLYSLSEIPQAHAYMESNKATGKIVVKVD